MSYKVHSRIKEEARKVQEKMRLTLSKPLTRNIFIGYLEFTSKARKLPTLNEYINRNIRYPYS